MENLKHYKIVERLGHGGMGTVYKAFDTVLERHVALKVMHAFLMQDGKNAERFMNEAKAAARLMHPNIVTIYEVGSAAEGMYIAMEYVQGEPLTKMLATNGVLPPEMAIRLASQIVQGLGAAHGMGILHRDIKAENILVTPQHAPKILDFGIAKIAAREGLTSAGDILGTIEYMAPEQMMGDAVDHRCDLYSAGVVLYQMLTNRLPFTGENPVAILYKQLNEEPIAPSYYNTDVQPDLDKVVLKALNKSPEERWADAKEFAAALDALLASGAGAPAAGAAPFKFPFEIDLDEENASPQENNGLIRNVFVGREKELKKLVHAFNNARRGIGHTVIMLGEAGVGKSTLASMLEEYARRHDALVLYGACLYQEGMDAYLPYIDALRKFFSSESFSLSQEQRLTLKALVHDKVPLLMEFTERFTTKFEGTLAAPETERPAGPDQLEGIHLLISALSSMKPVLLVIDDLQWADEASLRLFHYLSRQIDKNRVLLLGISRTDRYDLQQNGKPSMIVDVLARMQREGISEQIQVNRLTREECDSLMDNVLQRAIFSEEFYARVYRETRGNPFIVLETLKNLQESGGIYLKDGAWYDREEGVQFDVPDRVEDVFVRRLNGLDAEEREIMQIAALIGYKFDPSILAAIVEMPKIKLLRLLQRIDRELELLVSTDEGFQFEHPMLRDLLYNEIPKPLRKEYHLMVAEELEKIYGANYGAHIGDVAQHFFRGGRDAKAAPLLFKAAERAFKISAYHEASLSLSDLLAAVERSHLELPPEIPLSSVYLKLGICLEETGRYEQSLEALQKLLEIGKEMNDPKTQVEALRRIGRVHDKCGCWDEALDSLGRCLAILEQHPLPNFLSRIYNNIGAIHLQQGRFDDALIHLHKATDAVDHEMGEFDRAHALANIGIIHNIRGEHSEASLFYEKALAIYQERGDQRGQARIYHNLGMTYADLHRWDESIEMFDRCFELAEKLQDKSLRALTLLNSAKSHAGCDDIGKAEESARKALKIFRRMNDKLNVAEAFHVLGLIHIQKKNHGKAESYFQESIQLNEEMAYQEGLGEVYLDYGDLLVKMAKPESAAAYFEKAEAVFRALNLRERLDEIRSRRHMLQPGKTKDVVVVGGVPEKIKLEAAI